MIDATKAPSPQAANEPQGAAAASRQPAAAPFKAWVSSGNGEPAFEPPQAWTAKPEPKAPAAAAPQPVSQPQAQPVAVAAAEIGDPAFVPPPAWGRYQPVVVREAAVQIAAADDSWRAGEGEAPAPAAPAAEAVALVTSNGEPAFVPPSVTDEVRRNAVNKGNVHMFAEGDEPTVWDFLDLINPLQHIPLINLVYRELTGDKIGALPQIVGGAVLGGPIGGIAAVANVVVQEVTGKDLGGHVVAMFDGDTPGETMTAGNAAPAVPAAAPQPQAEQPAQGRGRIEVVPTPTPANFVPYSQAPADMLPQAEAEARAAQAQAAKAKPGEFKPVPPRTNPTPPLSAGANALPSAESLKRAAAAQGLQDSAHPLINPNPEEAGEQETRAPAAAPRRAISASDSVQPQADAGNSADFVSKFMAAMDKYDKASRLGSPPVAAPAATRKPAG